MRDRKTEKSHEPSGQQPAIEHFVDLGSAHVTCLLQSNCLVVLLLIYNCHSHFPFWFPRPKRIVWTRDTGLRSVRKWKRENCVSWGRSEETRWLQPNSNGLHPNSDGLQPNSGNGEDIFSISEVLSFVVSPSHLATNQSNAPSQDKNKDSFY